MADKDNVQESRDYYVDTPQFCTQRCAAIWGHRMAEADNLAAEYAVTLIAEKAKFQ